MSSMSPRERILCTMRRQQPDRVPAEAGFTPPLSALFQEKTGQEDPVTYFGMCRRSVEIRRPQPPADFSRYLPPIPPDAVVDEWGNPTVHGFKYDTTDYVYPMRGLRTVAELDEFPLPDFSQEQCHGHFEAEVRRIHDAGLAAVSGGLWGTLFERTWHMRGMDNLFMDFYDNPAFATALLDKMVAIRTFQAVRFAEAGVDILHLGDDIGSEHQLLLGVPMWRRWFKPRLAQVIAAARRVKPDLLVEYHSDGYIEPFIPELIEVGIDVLNPVQPECMDPAAIKRQYGDRLAFSGTVGTQTTMPFGSADEVRRVVAERIRTVGLGGGLVLAPTHVLEPDVPWENIVAFFEAAEEFGSMPNKGGSRSHAD
jgi:uroporphyrinogen decarboxylase